MQRILYIFISIKHSNKERSTHRDGYNIRRNTKVCIGLLLVWWRIVVLLVSLSQHELCLFIIVLAFCFTNARLNLALEMYSKQSVFSTGSKGTGQLLCSSRSSKAGRKSAMVSTT